MEELTLEERVNKAVKKCMGWRDAWFLDEINGFLLFEEEEVVVFVKPSYEIGKFPNPNHDKLRRDFENAMITWFSEPENRDKTDLPIRCDSFEVNVIADDRALIRHVVNAFGRSDGYHDWH